MFMQCVISREFNEIMMYFRALITYENGFSKYQNSELLKELCEMSFDTVTKQKTLAETESCCACDEAVYEVGEQPMKILKYLEPAYLYGCTLSCSLCESSVCF